MINQLILPGPPDEPKIPIKYPDNFKFGGILPDTVGAVITEALKYLFPLAGLILFFIFISAGFNMLTAAGNEEKVKKAQAQLTAGITGFLILVIAFWLVKLLESVFGVKIF